MNNTKLYIEDVEVDLDENVQFALNKQFEDLTNPTTVINDWSKTVSIPFTEHNNNLFGNIYNPDRLIAFSSGDSTGIYFNPFLKLNFRLEYNGDVVMYGYAKMNTIERTSSKQVYNITLNGELGKVFQEMKKITFDTSSTDGSTYIIDGSTYINTTLTKELVKQCWDTSVITHDDIEDASVNEIIGFAANNAYMDDFDYTSFQVSNSKIMKFSEVLDEVGFETESGITSETVIGDGMTPRGVGEFRSYHQLPYIYWNKLFQIFENKTEELTGYGFDLDASWFNSSNPYWSKLVYMLKPLTSETETPFTNNYTFADKNYTWYIGDNYATPIIGNYYASRRDESIPMADSATSYTTFTLPTDKRFIMFKMSYGVNIRESVANDYLKPDNGLMVRFKVTGSNGHTEYVNYILVSENTTVSESGYINQTIGDRTQTGSYYYRKTILSPTLMISSASFGSSVYISTQVNCYKNEYPFGSDSGQPSGTGDLKFSSYTFVSNTEIYENYRGSNKDFILNDLWDNNYNLFEQILNYCKVFRILVYVDDLNKKVKFVPAEKFFESYSVEDWTDKLDMTKDYLIQPITWENKYVKFNYDDSKTRLNESYNQKYGVNFGEKKIITDYNFDTETDELFSGIKLPMSYSPSVLSWNRLYYDKAIIYALPAEIYVNDADGDNKYIECFGQWYLWNGIQYFDTESALKLRNCILTDDTPLQIQTSTYTYSQDSNSVSVTKFPKLDIIYDGKVCTYNVPNEVYTYDSSAYNNAKSIYYLRWSKYLDERYNIQNKLVTCYLRLNPIDYCNFKFNKFIKINNQLYMVNEIIDYDVTSRESTKCKLITIQDINSYTTTNN